MPMFDHVHARTCIKAGIHCRSRGFKPVSSLLLRGLSTTLSFSAKALSHIVSSPVKDGISDYRWDITRDPIRSGPLLYCFGDGV
jgi:hypothetical protein